MKKSIFIIYISTILFIMGCQSNLQDKNLEFKETLSSQMQAVTFSSSLSVPETSSPEVLNSSVLENEKDMVEKNQYYSLELKEGHQEIKTNVAYKIDLDNNGVIDEILVRDKQESGGSGNINIVLTINGLDYSIGKTFGIGKIFLIINEKLMPILIINNDGSSDDFCCWTIPLYQLKPKEIFLHGGEVIDISGNIITLSDYIYVLGSYYAKSSYTLNEKGDLAYLTNDTWYFSSDNLVFLTLKKDLSVEIREKEKYHREKIKVGEKICLTAVEYIDTNSLIAFFKTENGKLGKFSLRFDSNEFSYYINNIKEKDFFESLPYSG